MLCLISNTFSNKTNEKERETNTSAFLVLNRRSVFLEPLDVIPFLRLNSHHEKSTKRVCRIANIHERKFFCHPAQRAHKDGTNTETKKLNRIPRKKTIYRRVSRKCLRVTNKQGALKPDIPCNRDEHHKRK